MISKVISYHLTDLIYEKKSREVYIKSSRNIFMKFVRYIE
jgi:hypothetical protein